MFGQAARPRKRQERLFCEPIQVEKPVPPAPWTAIWVASMVRMTPASTRELAVGTTPVSTSDDVEESTYSRRAP